MIKANELRIGNWLLFSNMIQPEKYVQVNAWFLRQLVNDINDINPTLNGYYSPIPLTPEILEKCDLEQIKKISQLLTIETGPFETEFIETERTVTVRGKQTWCVKILHTEIKVISLHQLQNLYFALTGEELNIKL